MTRSEEETWNRALGQGRRKLVANEDLAHRIDVRTRNITFGGLSDLIAVIETAVYDKQVADRTLPYRDALFAVAMEQPWLFLTKARMELQSNFSEESIYFTSLPSGELVNPCTWRDGKFIPMDSPLDSRALPPGSPIEQEISLRVAAEMLKSSLVAHERGCALKSEQEIVALVASEHPHLYFEFTRRCAGHQSVPRE
jgi:hypothetical protein